MTPTEREQAIWMANKALDAPNADPDDDLRTISRQFLRSIEQHDKARNQAIDNVINWIKSEIKNEDYTQGDNYDKHSYGRVCAFNDIIEHLESLKTKP